MSDQYQYLFSGRILPERTNVHLDPPVEFSGEDREFSISIASSQVTVIVTSDDKFNNIYTIRNQVKSHVHSITDVFSFTHGYAYSVEITSVVHPDNQTTVFGVGIPVIKSKLEDDEVMEMFNLIWGLYGTEARYYIDSILKDFRLSMMHPHDTGVFCYRSAETIRKYFHYKFGIPEDDNDDIAEGWEKMRSELDIDRDDLEEIKQYADERRHGGEIEIGDGDRATVFVITWDVIDSFVCYLENAD